MYVRSVFVGGRGEARMTDALFGSFQEINRGPE
jgi:hypothetical protein